MDGCVSVRDSEAVRCALWMARNEGVWVGPSAAGNVVGAVKAGMRLKRERGGGTVKVVTILCDSGAAYGSKVRSCLQVDVQVRCGRP